VRREICISFQIIQLSAGILSTDLFAREKPTRTLRFVADVFPDLVEEVDHKGICGPVPYLAKAATESLGYRYEVELLPLARALKSIRTGSRDGIIGIYKNEERDAYIRYTRQPVYTDTIRVFTQKKSNMNWDGSLDSLKSARIGVMLGWYYTDRFRKLEKDDPRFRFEWIPLRESGFKMLRAQRIEVLISNDRNYQNFQENGRSSPKAAAEAQDLLPLEPPLETKGIYIGFARQVPSDVIQSFDKALDQLLKETRFQEKLPDPKTLCPAP
jgi:polar amino acid transport system substrate-binding protein